jgi:hypothetical protein
MGFLDDIGGGGARYAKFDGKVGDYVVSGSDAKLTGQEFIVGVYEAKAGHLKFNGKGQVPERALGNVFPKDEAPPRSTLGDTDKSEWRPGRFSDEPEDPWTPVIEIPMRHKETGDEYVFTAQSKTALAAAKDFLGQCRRLPEGYEPIVRLNVGSFKTKYGSVKKPILTIIGKVAMDGGDEQDAFGDEIPF